MKILALKLVTGEEILGEIESESVTEFVIKWNDPKFGMEWPTNTPILQKRDS